MEAKKEPSMLGGEPVFRFGWSLGVMGKLMEVWEEHRCGGQAWKMLENPARQGIHFTLYMLEKALNHFFLNCG